MGPPSHDDVVMVGPHDSGTMCRLTEVDVTPRSRHISIALQHFTSSRPIRFEGTNFSIRHDISNDVRRHELQGMIQSYAILWLQRMAQFDTARAMLAENPKAAHVVPMARADLGLLQQSTGR